MAIIYTYPKLSSLNGKDSFLVTDASDNNKTKTITWEDVLSSEGIVQNVKVTLTPAQILDLHNTYVELIPAPGVGKFIQVLGIYQYLDFQTTPYITSVTPPPNPTTSQISVMYGDDIANINGSAQLVTTNILSGSESWYVATSNFPFLSNAISTWKPNKGLYAFCQASNLAGDSPVYIYISYIIKDL